MKRPLAVVLALAALPATASAVLPSGGGTVDVTSADGRLAGGPELLGNVSAVGDFTGDKGSDLAVVQRSPRAIRVIHGGALDGARAVDAPAATVITSASRTVTAAAGAGDVNGDGIGDLVVGSCDPAASDPGRVWVVHGRAGTAPIDLDALGAGGFAVDGSGSECLGRSVAAAGDFNGDGIGDVIAGAHKAAGNTGHAVVLLGPGGAARFDLAPPSTGGPFAGTHVAGVGDVNGDGKADVAVGAPGFDSGYGLDSGAVWVTHGRSGSGAIALTDGSPGDQQFRVDGHDDGAKLSAVSAAGDVNKDGRADVAVGGPGPTDTFSVVGVVFGRTATTAMATGGFADGGYRFTSTSHGDRFGFDVRGGADVNGDGIPDVVAGAPDAPVGTAPERLRAGKAFVLFGRGTAESAVDVNGSAFEARGVRILGFRGEQVGEQAQDPSLIGFESWIGLGDVTCDGAADVLLGTGAARIAGGGTDPGAVFIHRGAGGTPFACTGGGGGGGGGGGVTPVPTATPPAGGDGQVVRLVRARLKNTRMRIGRRPTALSGARRRTPFGTTVQFEISEPATMTFRLTCRRPRGKQKAFCKKLKRSTFTRRVRTAGKSTFAFSGRVGRKKLVLGTYAFTVVATDADGSSAPRTLKFKVVRR